MGPQELSHTHTHTHTLYRTFGGCKVSLQISSITTSNLYKPDWKLWEITITLFHHMIAKKVERSNETGPSLSLWPSLCCHICFRVAMSLQIVHYYNLLHHLKQCYFYNIYLLLDMLVGHVIMCSHEYITSWITSGNNYPMHKRWTKLSTSIMTDGIVAGECSWRKQICLTRLYKPYINRVQDI